MFYLDFTFDRNGSPIQLIHSNFNGFSIFSSMSSKSRRVITNAEDPIAQKSTPKYYEYPFRRFGKFTQSSKYLYARPSLSNRRRSRQIHTDKHTSTGRAYGNVFGMMRRIGIWWLLVSCDSCQKYQRPTGNTSNGLSQLVIARRLPEPHQRSDGVCDA